MKKMHLLIVSFIVFTLFLGGGFGVADVVEISDNIVDSINRPLGTHRDSILVYGGTSNSDETTKGRLASIEEISTKGDMLWSLLHSYQGMSHNTFRDVLVLENGTIIALNIVSNDEQLIDVVTHILDGKVIREIPYENEYSTRVLPAEGGYLVEGKDHRSKDANGGWFYPTTISRHAADGQLLWEKQYDMELSMHGLLETNTGALMYGQLQDYNGSGEVTNRFCVLLLDADGGIKSINTGEPFTTISFGVQIAKHNEAYYAVGTITDPEYGDMKSIVFCFDASGNITTETQLEGTGMQILLDVCATKAGVLIAGKEYGGSDELNLYTIDATGSSIHHDIVQHPFFSNYYAVLRPLGESLEVVIIGNDLDRRTLTFYAQPVE